MYPFLSCALEPDCPSSFTNFPRYLFRLCSRSFLTLVVHLILYYSFFPFFETYSSQLSTERTQPPPRIDFKMMVMLYQAIVTASLLASINAVPLNINLGAYSPALYVPPCLNTPPPSPFNSYPTIAFSNQLSAHYTGWSVMARSHSAEARTCRS